ncbi:hypothetical protein M569_13888 [Genlisea aurea]|uniref:Condensin complex subunit 2 n=1 Tax=Genlisea aurea TaxID=192259 RepID=S8DMN8_9LAMI|nr:hypothetical protein M569_13888 [Genlisea aurea]
MLCPNPKPRVSLSPMKNTYFVGSNDDQFERAEARVARAAAIRRKSVVRSSNSNSSNADACLGKDQILELFHNCIKLASENKITQKNTWELNLIDHLCEIVKVEEEDDAETNFQKASCTLEAGVKIYSLRVDSTYSEAYKVLGGINRVGNDNEQDQVVDDGNTRAEDGEIGDKKDQVKKLSPSSTLEPSVASLNVKKFDVAFAVDPLYHQTSAQFDEGGAKGLLFNNLSVYDDCRVLFDSLEIPGKISIPGPQVEAAKTVDLSFANECIQNMVSEMLKASEITPSLRAIREQFGDDDRRPCDSYASAESSVCGANDQLDSEANFDDNNNAGSFGAWEFDHDDRESVVDDGAYAEDRTFPIPSDIPDMASDRLSAHEPDEENRLEEVDQYLFGSLGFSTKLNAWAGPNHWKYRKVKVPENPSNENAIPPKDKGKTRRKADPDIDFSSAVNNDHSHVFLPPKNPKSSLLPKNRTPVNTKLPEDCHYQPEDLVKLFLLPHVLCVGKRGRKTTTDKDSSQPNDRLEEENVPWDGDDDDDDGGDGYGGEAYHDSVEDSDVLVKEPRKTSKIEVRYDTTSKQVDLHSLKQTIWEHIFELSRTRPSHDEETFREDPAVEREETTAEAKAISFKEALATFPDNCRAAASLRDISPHLCFICLLHLANEHGFRIVDRPTLDDLTVHLKP